jgi:ribonuclease-3
MVKSKQPTNSVLEKELDYHFKDANQLTIALTHRSFGQPHNERLEFLGDGLLNCVIAVRLFERFPKANEGELTRLRANLVCKQTLSKVAQRLNLADYLQLGQGELKSAGFRRDSILADALEAIIGAIYIDSDWAQAAAVVQHLFQDELCSVDMKSVHKDPKTRLQEWLQARQLPLPTYEVIQLSGPAHDQHFTVSCRLEQFGEQIGTGDAKRIAEQMAAEKMLEVVAKHYE